MTKPHSEKEKIAKNFYDNTDIDKIYTKIWGGEHIAFGIYTNPDDPIHEASQRTVETMAETLQHLDRNSHVIDLGAGYGGSARYLAKKYGCCVTCLNLSDLQNQRNRQLNEEQGLATLVKVKGGTYEDVPYPDDSFDIVWSKDAMIHSGDRHLALAEARRVLKPGGELIFTDTLRNDGCPVDRLQPAFDRLGVNDAGSFLFYRHALEKLGFTQINIVDLSKHVHTHYVRVRDEILAHYDELVELTSKESVDNSLKSIGPWIDFYQKGDMQWGLFHCCLPKP